MIKYQTFGHIKTILKMLLTCVMITFLGKFSSWSSGSRTPSYGQPLASTTKYSERVKLSLKSEKRTRASSTLPKTCDMSTKSTRKSTSFQKLMKKLSYGIVQSFRFES